jgi:hypothetical protein
MGVSRGDSRVVSLGVREMRLEELEFLKASGDLPDGVLSNKPSILVGCGVESHSCKTLDPRSSNSIAVHARFKSCRTALLGS